MKRPEIPFEDYDIAVKEMNLVLGGDIGNEVSEVRYFGTENLKWFSIPKFHQFDEISNTDTAEQYMHSTAMLQRELKQSQKYNLMGSKCQSNLFLILMTAQAT